MMTFRALLAGVGMDQHAGLTSRLRRPDSPTSHILRDRYCQGRADHSSNIPEIALVSRARRLL